MTELTREEIKKNKTLCNIIKPLKVFRNNLTGKRFIIDRVPMEPIQEGLYWKVECSTVINKGHRVPFTIRFEALANGLRFDPNTNTALYTLIR